MAVTTSEAKNNVPAVIVFGDSSVDSGNNNVIATVLKSNFKPYGRDFEGGRPTGRFCNGRVPPDFIAEAFGIKRTVPAYLDPAYTIQDFATGVCFASAGTGYDNATSAVLVSVPVNLFHFSLLTVFLSSPNRAIDLITLFQGVWGIFFKEIIIIFVFFSNVTRNYKN